MTLRGILVCFFEVFLVILALGTQMKEFFIVAVCLAGLIVFSVVSIILASLTLRVDSKINKKATIRGDKIEYTLIVKGIALLPVAAYLSLKTTELEFNMRSRKRYSFVLLPSFTTTQTFTFEVPSVHIGSWEIGIKRMRFEDVFGLFAFPLIRLGKRDFAVDMSVMPMIHNLAVSVESLSTGGYGDTGYKNAEEGDLLGDSRPYKVGDSLKRINWKLSARTKSIYSRQYEMPQKPKVVIVVDNAVFSDTVSDVADIVCETAISLGNHFLSRNNIVEIATIRAKKKQKNKNYTLEGYYDIHKVQYDFAHLKFYKNEEELTLKILEDSPLLLADRVYIVSSNPSNALLSDLTDINKTGKIAKCFVPKTSQNSFSSDDFAEVRVNIEGVDQISETVGRAL